MKKIFLAAPLALALFACNDETVEQKEEVNKATEQAADENEDKVLLASADKDWTVDPRLQEPTEDTVCAMCNMKVYTKDHEMGVFAAQAIKADGSVVFYDDIGCLLNAEFAHEEANEKFVRDYNTLNWFNVEQAYIVKTKLKSPMNWGYIFFKYEDDAQAFIDENEGSKLTSYTEVRQQALERRKAKIKAGTNVDAHHEEDGHVHGEDHGHSEGDDHGHSEGEGHGEEENHGHENHGE